MARPLLDARLVRMTLRRFLTPGLVVALFALFVVAAASGGAHGRQSVFSTFAWIVVPIVVVRAAGCGDRWRQSDADWFAPLPARRRLYSGAVCTALWASAFVLAGLATCVSAFAADGSVDGAENASEGALRWVRTLDHPAFASVDGDERVEWTQSDLSLADLPPRSVVIARPTVAPGSGPAVSIRVTLTSGADVDRTPLASAQERIFGRARLALAIPIDAARVRTDAPLRFAFERIGSGAVCVLPPRSIDVLVPSRSTRWGSFELGLRFALALAAWGSLAAGLGAWMRASIAASLTLALASACVVGARLAPGADIAHAWTLVGEGLVPPFMTAASIALSVATALAGALLFHAGIETGRSAR